MLGLSGPHQPVDLQSPQNGSDLYFCTLSYMLDCAVRHGCARLLPTFTSTHHIISIIIKGIYKAQVRKGHKCATRWMARLS